MNSRKDEKDCIKYGIGSLVIVDDINEDLSCYTDISNRIRSIILELREANITRENLTQVRLKANEMLTVYINPDACNNPYIFIMYRKDGENRISQWVRGEDVLFITNHKIYSGLQSEIGLMFQNKSTKFMNLTPEQDLVKIRNFVSEYDISGRKDITTQAHIIERNDIELE